MLNFKQKSGIRLQNQGFWAIYSLDFIPNAQKSRLRAIYLI
jgi:hypothetical protein